MSRKTRRLERAALQPPVRRLSEALDAFFMDKYVDPRDDYVDPETGELWLGVGTDTKNWRDQQERWGVPQTEVQLKFAREQCRLLAAANEFAINGLENRISYIVGSGHSYDVRWKKGEEPEKPEPADGDLAESKQPDPDLKAVKAGIAKFVEVNCWHHRQQEIVRRKDRDGECFLRLFAGVDGMTRVRFVEPAQVYQPPGNPDDTFGIKTDPDDVETVLGYWVDGVLVDAAEIQHRKANVDANVKRGLPTFWPVRKNLRRAEKLLRNMSIVGEIQTAIAIIRKHGGATKSGVEQFVAGNTDLTTTNQVTGKAQQFRRYAPGTILDTSAGMEYEFPAAGLDAGRYVQVLQAELRAIASRLVMPEFMLSSDASNANYSSTMVAEGPAVKMFERLQWEGIEDDLALIRKALLGSGIPQDTLDRMEIIAVPPTIQSRDRLKDAQADYLLQRAGAISAQTIAERNDLEWDTEEERMAGEKAKNPPPPQLSPGQGDVIPFNRDDGTGVPATEAERMGMVRRLLWEGYP